MDKTEKLRNAEFNELYELSFEMDVMDEDFNDDMEFFKCL